MKNLKSVFLFALLPILMFPGCKKDKDIPTVLSSTPKHNSTGVSATAAVAFTFSEVMDPLTINNKTVTMTQGSTPVSGVVTYANKVATFTPAAKLFDNALYSAAVSVEAESKKGIALKEGFTIAFTTAQGVDTIITDTGTVNKDKVAPLVHSTNPLSNATGVARNEKVSIVFNEAMDPQTINSTNFTLKKGSACVTGTVTYDANTATFTSSTNLESNTTYTANITTGATDVAGNALASNKQWSFTTSGTSASLAMVNLGGAGNYVILAKTAINNISTSAIVGDLALSPAATSYITGFSLTNATGYATSAQVTGSIYAADMAAPTPGILTTAVNDMITAYNDAAGRPTPDFVEFGTGNIGGKTLSAGLYKWSSTVTIPTDVTLSGDADAVWIFQIDGDLTQSSATNVTLIGGAQAKNVFWQVAGEATFGANAHFEGNILSMTGITFLTGASMKGRALAQTAVILDANAVTKVQ